MPDVLKDMNSGHRFVASVFSDCATHHRTDGPEHLRPVGETEFVAAEAEKHAKAHPDGVRVCAGIMSSADHMLGERMQEVLEAHIDAGRGRFRGIRGHTHYDAEETVARTNWPDRMLYDPRVREAIACLAPLSLVYDSWLFHPQIPHLARPCARPATDHHRARPLRRTARHGAVGWQGGRGLPRVEGGHARPGALRQCLRQGWGPWHHHRGLYPLGSRNSLSSEELAHEWSRWITPAIEIFGPQRCMFQSNFPIDKRTASSAVLWNAFKRLAQGYSPEEKVALFSGTAKKVRTDLSRGMGESELRDKPQLA